MQTGKGYRVFTFPVMCSDEYMQSPEKVDLKLTHEDIDKLRKYIDIIQGDDDIAKIGLNFGEMEFFSEGEDDNDDPDYKIEMESIVLTDYGIRVEALDGWCNTARYFTDSIPFSSFLT